MRSYCCFALLAFVYVLFPPIWQPSTPKMLCSTHTLRTHSLSHTCHRRLRSVDRSHTRTRAHSTWLSTPSLSLWACPQLWFLASFAQCRLASSFSCLRAVFECATGLRKALLALALFNHYSYVIRRCRCCSCALFAALRCCTTTTTTSTCCYCCCCRVCHSKFDSASF